MNKIFPQNFFSLMIAIACAAALSDLFILTRPSASILLLSTIIIALCLQVAYLRRDLSALKEQITGSEKR